MKTRNLLFKSATLIVFLSALWGCSKEKEPIVEDEKDPAGTVYFEEDFEKMVWGGDYINQKAGVKGEFIKDEEGHYIVDQSQATSECAINTDGCPDFFALVSEAYKVSRDIQDWDGNKVYERPGYLKIGTSSSRDAYIRTPALEEIGAEPQDVQVSLDLAIWGGSSQTLYIQVIDGGIASVGQLEVSTKDSWTSSEFNILKATKDTKIEIKSDPTQTGRFFLSDISVKKLD